MIYTEGGVTHSIPALQRPIQAIACGIRSLLHVTGGAKCRIDSVDLSLIGSVCLSWCQLALFRVFIIYTHPQGASAITLDLIRSGSSGWPIGVKGSRSYPSYNFPVVVIGEHKLVLSCYTPFRVWQVTSACTTNLVTCFGHLLSQWVGLLPVHIGWDQLTVLTTCAAANSVPGGGYCYSTRYRSWFLIARTWQTSPKCTLAGLPSTERRCLVQPSDHNP